MPDISRIATIRRLRASGASWAEVGAALGLRATTAQGYAARHCPDLIRSGPPKRRAATPPGDSAKLRRIRRLRVAGWSWPAIGHRLGLSTYAVWHYGTTYDPSLRLRTPRRR